MATPRCPYFGKCGGCSAQHIDYPVQVENKRKILQSAAKADDVRVFSGSEYAYRNRMDLVFHPHGIGLRCRGRCFDIVDVEKCAISNEKVNKLIAEVRDFFQNPDALTHRDASGALRYAVIRAPSHCSSISFVLNSKSQRIAEAVEKVKEFAQKSSAENILVTYTSPEADVSISSDFFVVKGSDMLQESFMGKKFWFSAQGFFQNNTEMAEKLHEYCNSLLLKYDTKNAALLDVYAGVGCFGIINSHLFRQVFIVENSAECIKAAKKNIEENKASNCGAFLLDDRRISRLELPERLFVIADPPRIGMDEKAIIGIKAHRPEVIIYISCNARQLAKDIPKFKDYTVESAALFDLFPQTPHMECVVELRRKSDVGSDGRN